MEKSLKKMLSGYQAFRKKYSHGNKPIMELLADHGQKPKIMVVACCDSRVDPALILQCDPGDLFVVRNVANIVPPYELDTAHHGTSAALEFGVRHLNIQNLVLLGHSQCGGIQALLDSNGSQQDDFITSWVSIIKTDACVLGEPDDCAKLALKQSYDNCMSFPWIKEKVVNEELIIHLWFFDIKKGEIFRYCEDVGEYRAL